MAQDASPEASAAVESYEPQGPQVDELVMWTRSSVDTSPNEWKALEDATGRYTELIGTKVKLVTVPDDDFRSKLSQAAPGGDGPDVFGPVAHDWIGEVALQQIAMPWEDGEIVLISSNRLAQNRSIFLGTTANKMLRSLPVPMVVIPRYHAPDLTPDKDISI